MGVHTRTLTRWEAQGKIKAIRTSAGQRRYDLEEYLRREGKRCARHSGARLRTEILAKLQMTVKIPVFCMPELPPEARWSSFRCLLDARGVVRVARPECIEAAEGALPGELAKNRDATPATPPFRKNQTSRRQTADLMAEYPGCEAIAEIGSGLNFRRRCARGSASSAPRVHRSRFLAMVIPYAVSKMYCGCPPRPAS
ncbi:MAG: hypothetical protein GDA48_25165 [Hormoscilla sp. GM102CHS1]|nr:hypothetical protein [Hormoscilla sp. GM102CHS1]